MDPLVIDIYAGDGHPDISQLVSAGPPWSGVILKATQGNYYDGGDWLRSYWPAVRRVGGDRYGKDWLRGAYHYIDFSVDAELQANTFLAAINRAGGWSYGDLGPIVDVERGGQRGLLTKSHVEDVTSKVTEILHRETGLAPILYGGELIRSLEITDHMGCSAVWVARYAPTLPPATYESMGWQRDDLLMWQYAGKTTATRVDSFLPNYPATTPAGLADVSALTMPMDEVRRRWFTQAA